MDRRLDTLEANYQDISRRLGSLDNKMGELDALKNQISGMINLVKFVGFSGLVTLVVFMAKSLSK